MSSLYGSLRARGAVFKVGGVGSTSFEVGGGVLKLGCIKILTFNQCKETKDNSN